MKNKIMCHVVAGYPSPEECLELLIGMQEAGVDLIEVQIPFSDPIADGETIMRANDAALARGMTIDDSFGLIRRAREKGLKSKVYIMSYAQKIVHCGIEDFCRRAGEVGAAGLIVPDLPFDSPEYEKLKKAVQDNSLQIVPVISPGMSSQRLAASLDGGPRLIYLTSTKGITGNKLSMSASLGDLCESARKLSPDSILAVGFGVQNKQDVAEVLKIADVAVVGSSVIRKIESSGSRGAIAFIKRLIS